MLAGDGDPVGRKRFLRSEPSAQIPEWAPAFCANVPDASKAALAEYLRQARVAGTLAIADPERAGRHFCSLVIGTACCA